ncbi:hypothetical protein SAMN05660461_3300 [Chitinophaga ginsengisegetis]|uniref:PEGA domain-containing protein n=1 Tax=Chitinophaga ginsengisegetis TaxID=393003 RepID=A0A1T5P045_9BACT|nr:hypothetical protein [Chitinophaga ginsengisegetis]MDR6566960.1 hypothetical protein [Chitinophaga ginsengisegetis]MDR6646690.1 hypothetical protein [Chitinophaga ginsengisegetis]MDR6653040.1 hypothetical protein [Chitinophaga ginsengisegetis]SKD06090.1 hypothetical protein SAMN05660461_3300 [Chitinophaga ginsengisegetis]
MGIQIKALLFCCLAAFTFFVPNELSAKVKSKKIVINTENDARIYVDGKLVNNTSTEIKVAAYAQVNIRVEKVGFITQERNYINDGKHTLPSTDYIKLEKDDAYENSMVTNLANQDIDVRTSHDEENSWKLINRIITGYFDVIAVTDKATGYMCTAWVVKSFKAATIRTRLIIKTGNTDPLTYKAKLVSEIAPPGVSASSDESFRNWDRLLRTFENVVPELQSRLAK